MPLPVMQMPKVEDDIMVFEGGLDLTTPNLKLKPGHVRSAQNWQCVANEEGGGYERIAGYEVYCGDTLGSSVSYELLVVSDWVHPPAEWNGVDHPGAFPLVAGLPVSWEFSQVRGLTSGALGYTLDYVDATITENYQGETYVAVVTTSGVFQVGETIVISGYTVSGAEAGQTATVGVITSLGTTTPIAAKYDAQLSAMAAMKWNQQYGAVPQSSGGGTSGSIIGVVSGVFNGVREVYCIQNVVGNLSAKLMKAGFDSSADRGGRDLLRWDPVLLHYEIPFTDGGTIGVATVPLEGSALSQGGLSWLIKRVVHESGAWDAATAAGRFIIELSVPYAGYVLGPATAGSIPVTIAEEQRPITLPPNGTYQFDVANFSGKLTTKRIYGANGEGRAFEFDGDVLVPISTGSTFDKPKFVRKHQDSLCLALGSSVMISAPGKPYVFNAPLGALEIATGDEVTGMQVQPGNQDTAAMAIFGRNSSGILYGTSTANFNYKALVSATGSLPYMQANLGSTYLLDDRGVLSFNTAQEFGNFKQATLTANIDKFLKDRRGFAIGCCVSSDRSQFRLFFSDGGALYLTIVNGRMIGAMPQQFPHNLTCVWSAEDEHGNEETFAGDESGRVFKLDSGTSFAGEPITHHLLFGQNFMKSPRLKKHLRNGHIEVQATAYTEFSIGYSLGYGQEKIFQPDPSSVASASGIPVVWDDFIWDQVFWDGVTNIPDEISLKGKAEAVQIIISGSSDYIEPFKLSSLITHFSYTRRTR